MWFYHSPLHSSVHMASKNTQTGVLHRYSETQEWSMYPFSLLHFITNRLFCAIEIPSLCATP